MHECVQKVCPSIQLEFIYRSWTYELIHSLFCIVSFNRCLVLCRLLPACSRLQRVYTFTKRKKILRNYDALELIGVALMSLLDVTMTLENWLSRTSRKAHVMWSHNAALKASRPANVCVRKTSICCVRRQSFARNLSRDTPRRTAPRQCKRAGRLLMTSICLLYSRSLGGPKRAIQYQLESNAAVARTSLFE